MKKMNNTLKGGIQMFLSLAVFFLLIYAVGLGRITQLRYLGIVVVLFFTNRLAKQNFIKDNDIGYVKNLISLFLANALNIVLSIIGIAIFASFIDDNYISAFENDFFWGDKLGLTQILLGLFLEGIAGASIVSFSVMQYWKNYKIEKKAS